MKGLPETAEGTILIWNIPSSGGQPSDWTNRVDGNQCSFLEHIIAHEAGHAYGIGWPVNDHPTIKTESIMSYAPSIDYCEPQEYDVVAIEANYQSR